MESISHSDSGVRRTRVWAGTGIVGAIVASSCCVLPLVFFVLGIGGAWIAPAGLTAASVDRRRRLGPVSNEGSAISRRAEGIDGIMRRAF